MDAMDAIMQMLSQYAFPIVCCVYLLLDRRRTDAEHKEEVKGMSQAIENNTLVLQKLVDKLEEVTK